MVHLYSELCLNLCHEIDWFSGTHFGKIPNAAHNISFEREKFPGFLGILLTVNHWKFSHIYLDKTIYIWYITHGLSYWLAHCTSSIWLDGQLYCKLCEQLVASVLVTCTLLIKISPSSWPKRLARPSCCYLTTWLNRYVANTVHENFDTCNFSESLKF